MITAIIFDLDGLLADTEPLQMQAYQLALLANGVVLTDEEYARYWIREGRGIQEFLKDRRIRLAPAAVLEQKARRYRELLETSLEAMPGAHELLERLHGRTRLAVASSSNRKEVEYVLQRLDFARFMEVVAAREDEELAKPAPDVFLFVAERLGVEPAECLVVEDAEKGIIAAREAGMPGIAVPNRYTRDNDFSGAADVVESLGDVEGVVERM